MLSPEEARVLRAADGIVAASGVPSVHAIGVAADLRDDEAQAAAESLAERGLLRVELVAGAEQAPGSMATRRYLLTDEGADALRHLR